jgi:head-tail adaptor
LPVRLTRRLVLEDRVDQADGAGGSRATWVPVGTLWAELTARTGRETFTGGQPVPRARFRIVTRSAPAGAPSRPRPDQRFRDGARVFNILTVAEHDAAGHYLLIEAEEGVRP